MLCAEIREFGGFVLFDGVTFLEIPPHGRDSIAAREAIPVPLVFLMHAVDKLQVTVGAVVFACGAGLDLHALEGWGTVCEAFH